MFVATLMISLRRGTPKPTFLLGTPWLLCLELFRRYLTYTFSVQHVLFPYNCCITFKYFVEC